MQFVEYAGKIDEARQHNLDKTTEIHSLLEGNSNSSGYQ